MSGFYFYTMAQLVENMNRADEEHTKRQLETCREFANDLSIDAGKRLIWKDLEKMVRRHLKRY